MTAIIDYAMGNVGSIRNILLKAGERDVCITDKTEDIENADRLILPGVGAFDAGMKNLKERGLKELIKKEAEHKPILGICLGMQLLGTASEEGEEEGLGLIPFFCVRFRVPEDLKVPHMGWDYVDINSKDAPLVKGIETKQRYYFVHSYRAECPQADNILMTCDYGGDFPAAVYKGHIYGVQFHPEKSHQFGLNLFKNFLEVGL